MPSTARNHTERRAAIRAMLAAGPAATQRSLVEALRSRGFVATQSSVSRDLRELGAVKTGAGYELPAFNPAGDDEIGAVAALLRALNPAGANLLVIRTATGAAQRVALALDRSAWPEIVGTVAGDDTVFVATVNAQSQRGLVTRLERHAAER